MKRRSGIELIIGHTKFNHEMERSHLLGKEGDKINAILSASGFNMRKLLLAFFLSLREWLTGELQQREAVPMAA